MTPDLNTGKYMEWPPIPCFLLADSEPSELESTDATSNHTSDVLEAVAPKKERQVVGPGASKRKSKRSARVRPSSDSTPACAGPEGREIWTTVMLRNLPANYTQ